MAPATGSRVPGLSPWCGRRRGGGVLGPPSAPLSLGEGRPRPALFGPWARCRVSLFKDQAAVWLSCPCCGLRDTAAQQASHCQQSSCLSLPRADRCEAVGPARWSSLSCVRRPGSPQSHPGTEAPVCSRPGPVPGDFSCPDLTLTRAGQGVLAQPPQTPHQVPAAVENQKHIPNPRGAGSHTCSPRAPAAEAGGLWISGQPVT